MFIYVPLLLNEMTLLIVILYGLQLFQMHVGPDSIALGLA